MNGLFMAIHAAQRAAENAASGAAGRAASAARAARTDVSMLKLDVEKLLMITEALWSMLKEQTGYTDEDLTRRIQDIDLRDGKLDGKVAKDGPERCPNCHRTLLGDRPMCLYCGAPVKRDPFER